MRLPISRTLLDNNKSTAVAAAHNSIFIRMRHAPLMRKGARGTAFALTRRQTLIFGSLLRRPL